MTPTVAGTNGLEFPQPSPPDGGAEAVSEFDVSRTPGHPPPRALVPYSFLFPLSGPTSLAGCKVYLFEDPQGFADEPPVLLLLFLLLFSSLDESQPFSDESKVLFDEFHVLFDEPQVLSDKPQVPPDEVAV